jgi:hypothetical protein
MNTQRVYCDATAGQLIYFFHKDNIVARSLIRQIGNFEESLFGENYFSINHVRVMESLLNKFHKLELPFDETFAYEAFLLEIPDGQEIFKINWLFDHYHQNIFRMMEKEIAPVSDILNCIYKELYITTNSFYSLTGGAKETVFPFAKTHVKNLQLINNKNAKKAKASKKILVIDSGIDVGSNVKIINRKNFTWTNDNSDVTDKRGHGTFVAEIINDLCPGSKFIIYKIINDENFATEWDLTAALVGSGDAEIINMSLAYGLEEINCGNCGRLSTSSRSATLEFIIDHLVLKNKIIIAAAGNEGKNELSYPARFSNVLAIESINSSNTLSDFSNYSTINHVSESHNNVFVMPGGNNSPRENIFDSADFDTFGTSFAAAYASGVIAQLWSDNNKLAVADLIKLIKTNYVDKSFTGYNPANHGNGMIKF